MLCASCIGGYFKQSKSSHTLIFLADYSCSQCPNSVWNAFRITFAILLLILQIVFLVRATINRIKLAVPMHSVFLKILTNHLHLIGIVSGFDLDWPTLVFI